MGLVGELAVEPGADLPSVAQRPVADAQRVLAAGDEVGDELVDGGDPRADDLLHATGHCPYIAVEHLALAGVDDGHDHTVRSPVRERQQIERRDPDHRYPQRLGQRLGGGQADAHPREQSRPDIDGDEPDLVECHVRLRAAELDRRHEGFGMPPAASDLEQGDDPFVTTDGDTDLWGSCLDAEDQHGVAVNLPRQ